MLEQVVLHLELLVTVIAVIRLVIQMRESYMLKQHADASTFMIAGLASEWLDLMTVVQVFVFLLVTWIVDPQLRCSFKDLLAEGTLS
jgi:uncharacterized membrane protein